MKRYVGILLVLSLLVSFSCEKKREETKGEDSQRVERETVSEGHALADKKGCFACHDINRKKVGPSYSEIAKRYAGKENAVEELVRSITKGSMGKWGSIPMTPQPTTQEEARKLAEWILGLR